MIEYGAEVAEATKVRRGGQSRTLRLADPTSARFSIYRAPEGAYVSLIAQFRFSIFSLLSFCLQRAHARASAIKLKRINPTGSPDPVF
jgi:hypothetical protein